LCLDGCFKSFHINLRFQSRCFLHAQIGCSGNTTSF
jgi:hypothetical protein